MLLPVDSLLFFTGSHTIGYEITLSDSWPLFFLSLTVSQLTVSHFDAALLYHTSPVCSTVGLAIVIPVLSHCRLNPLTGLLVDSLCNLLIINSKGDDSSLHSSSLHTSSPRASIFSVSSLCIYNHGFPPRMHSNTAVLGFPFPAQSESPLIRPAFQGYDIYDND